MFVCNVGRPLSSVRHNSFWVYRNQQRTSSVISHFEYFITQIRRLKRVNSFLLTLETAKKHRHRGHIVVAPTAHTVHLNEFYICLWFDAPMRRCHHNFSPRRRPICLALSGLPRSKWPVVLTAISSANEKCACMCTYLKPVAEPKSKIDMFLPEKTTTMSTQRGKKNTHTHPKKEKSGTHFTSECALIVNLYVAFFFFVPVSTADETDVVRTRCCCFLYIF